MICLDSNIASTLSTTTLIRPCHAPDMGGEIDEKSHLEYDIMNIQEETMQVSKWGDSLAVRLPKALVEKMGLSAGDELNIVDVVERTLVVQKGDRRKAALDRLTSRNWTLPPDYKFDRDEANER